MAVSLGDLKTNAQVLYDIAGSTVLSGTEWQTIIQRAYKALWADVVSVCPTFRVGTTDFTLTTSQTQAVAADFRQVLKVLRDPGLATEVILPNFATRIAHSSWEQSYRMEGVNLVIEPLARCAGNYRLVYTKTCPAFVNDASTVDAELDQFEDVITYHAVVQAQTREETESGQFAALLEDGRKRVHRWAADQRKADPSQVEDVRGSSAYGWYGSNP